MSTSIAVLRRFIDRTSRPSYAHQFLSWLGDASESAYRIPDVTVGAVITVQGRTDPTRPTQSHQTLTVDQRAKLNHAVDDLEARQLLKGAYVLALADRMYGTLMNQLDGAAYAAILEAVAAEGGDNLAAWDGNNVHNKDLDTMTDAIFGDFESSLQDDGNVVEDFMLMANPRGYTRLANVFRAQIGAVSVQAPMLGVAKDGLALNGIPMVRNYAVPSDLRATATASTITSNVCVATIPAGHPFQVGMEIYTTGGGTNVASSSRVALTAVTATSVTYALTASNGSNGTPTIICPASPVLLIPRSKAFWAGDVAPRTKMVDDAEDAGGMALQAYSSYGRHVVDGEARMLLVP